MERNPTLIPVFFNGDKALFTKDSPAAMLVANADKIRGKLAIKIVIGSEDGLLKWTEQLHASLVNLKISHELEIVGGVGHDFGAPDTGIYEPQLRGLRYAADHFVLPLPASASLMTIVHLLTSRLLRDSDEFRTKRTS